MHKLTYPPRYGIIFFLECGKNAVFVFLIRKLEDAERSHISCQICRSNSRSIPIAERGKSSLKSSQETAGSVQVSPHTFPVGSNSLNDEGLRILNRDSEDTRIVLHFASKDDCIEGKVPSGDIQIQGALSDNVLAENIKSPSQINSSTRTSHAKTGQTVADPNEMRTSHVDNNESGERESVASILVSLRNQEPRCATHQNLNDQVECTAETDCSVVPHENTRVSSAELKSVDSLHCQETLEQDTRTYAELTAVQEEGNLVIVESEDQAFPCPISHYQPPGNDQPSFLSDHSYIVTSCDNC